MEPHIVEGMNADTIPFLQPHSLKPCYELPNYHACLIRREGSRGVFGINVNLGTISCDREVCFVGLEDLKTYRLISVKMRVVEHPGQDVLCWDRNRPFRLENPHCACLIKASTRREMNRRLEDEGSIQVNGS